MEISLTEIKASMFTDFLSNTPQAKSRLGCRSGSSWREGAGSGVKVQDSRGCSFQPEPG